MLNKSPKLNSLSLISQQGRGWSLDVAPLLLSSFRPSTLRSLVLQGVACNLSIENFESDNRQIAEYFLSLVELEELQLGGSIGRRNLELRMLMKDTLREGEREMLFPKLRRFEGTSTNLLWLLDDVGSSPIDTITINELEPIDEMEFTSLLNKLPSSLISAEITFARYDPLRPSVQDAILRMSSTCPRLQDLTISTVSSLRFSARSMTRISVPSSFSLTIRSVALLPYLSSLRLPPTTVCGIEGDVSIAVADLFKECEHLLRVDFAGAEQDGRDAALEATRWERRCTKEGDLIAVRIG